jgi:hypothetical protein
MLAVVVVIAFGVEASSTFATWGTLAPGQPPRINWCGRRYYPATETLTTAQVSALVAASTHEGELTEVARSPWGYMVMAAPMSPAQQSSFDTKVCAMVLFIKVGADRYEPYWLSGGP